MERTMAKDLLGKTILVVKGSLLATDELETALKEQGAHVQTASNIISAFALVERRRLDGVVLDKGLHNAAFELCAELQERNVPYVMSDKPHELQRRGARRRVANEVVEELIVTMGTKGVSKIIKTFEDHKEKRSLNGSCSLLTLDARPLRQLAGMPCRDPDGRSTRRSRSTARNDRLRF
jgi:DNA-binding NtrC family response regulator